MWFVRCLVFRVGVHRFPFLDFVSPQFNCFSLHRERGNALAKIFYTRMKLTPRWRKKTHAKTPSRKDRIEVWKLVSSFLCGFALWREFFFRFGVASRPTSVQ